MKRTSQHRLSQTMWAAAAVYAYLADILDRFHDHKINRLDELLPWTGRHRQHRGRQPPDHRKAEAVATERSLPISS